MNATRFYIRMLAVGLALCCHAAAAVADTRWNELSPKQQELLEPLKGDWSGMTRVQQERWLQVGRKYENEPAEKQAIMRERVSSWSGLSPREKAAARENYKALKEKRQGERNSSWNSYKSLDPKQRDEFKSKLNKPSMN